MGVLGSCHVVPLAPGMCSINNPDAETWSSLRLPRLGFVCMQLYAATAKSGLYGMLFLIFLLHYAGQYRQHLRKQRGKENLLLQPPTADEVALLHHAMTTQRLLNQTRSSGVPQHVTSSQRSSSNVTTQTGDAAAAPTVESPAAASSSASHAIPGATMQSSSSGVLHGQATTVSGAPGPSALHGTTSTHAAAAPLAAAAAAAAAASHSQQVAAARMWTGNLSSVMPVTPEATLSPVRMSATQQTTVVIMHKQDRNMHNNIFGGHLLRKAFELAYVNAVIHANGHCEAVSMGDVTFYVPVPVGCVLQFQSKVRQIIVVCLFTKKCMYCGLIIFL